MFTICQPFLIFDHFFAVSSVLHNERDHNTVMALVSKPVTSSAIENLPENLFADLLTPYTLQFVVKQLLLQHKVKIVDQQDDSVTFTVSSSEGTVWQLTYTYGRLQKKVNVS